jgi:hypothetical protein
MAKKKMSTGKKIAIGAGVAAVVGAILCWLYCPCFKKGAALVEPDVTSDAVPPEAGRGLSTNPRLPLTAAQDAATAATAPAPAALSLHKTTQILQAQRGHYNIPII